MNNNEKGNIGEIEVTRDLSSRGYQVSIPWGHACMYDLVVDRDGKLERVQVKSTSSNGITISVRACHQSRQHGTIKYTKNEIDWLAIYDSTTNKCYYVPAGILKGGRKSIRLRLVDSNHNENQFGTNLAKDYETI